MRNKVLVLGLLLGMGIAIVVDQRQRFDVVTARWLYPGLVDSFAAVTGLRIAKASEVVDLAFDNGRWVVVQRFNYPVNDQRLSQLLDQLGTARLLEKKTALAQHHAALGLLSESSDSALVLSLQGETAFKPVLIGQQASARQATFVRFQSEDQVWLIDQALDVSGAAADWLAPRLLTLNDARIKQIELSIPGDSDYRVVRDDRANWVLASLPEGRKLRYETALTPLTTTVAQLGLMDVAEHDPGRWAGAASAVYHLTSNQRVLLKTVMTAGDYWLRIGVETEVDDKIANTAEVDVVASQPLDEVLGASREALTRFDFKIAKRNFDDLNRSLESFLKPQEVEGIDG